ncbi:MAG: glycosyltransferase family 4 protein [Bacteroidetes bacterium]|nr:glycosyltransferase family 4 protein [Bacteroidota bacterium]
MFYLVILIGSFLLTYLIRLAALKKKVIDVPNERSSHTVSTPRGGGLAIVITIYSGWSYLYFENLIEKNLFYALLFGLPVSLTGILDDIIGLNYKYRLIIHSISAGGALWFTGGLSKVDTGIFTLENPVLLTGCAFIGILWFINLFNFLDGIDGYAATEAVFIAAALFGFISDQSVLIIAFSAMGFLVWNWQSAKIFMGDVGSTSIGFTFAVYAIWYQNNEKLSLITSAILTALFWFDATITLYRRLRNREILTSAHKKHAFQRLVQAGFSHQKTVWLSFLVNLFLLGLAMLSFIFNLFSPVLLGVSLIILYTIVKMIDRKKSFA